MPPPTLEQLYAAFLATGDEAALEQLMRRSAPSLRRHARRLGATEDDADDLVQETIVAAIQGADRFDPERPLLPWLKGILAFRRARLARDEVRRRRLYAESAARERPAPVEAPGAALAGRELAGDVRAAIDELPARYRAPLQQYLFAGRSPVEIAAGLGVGRATVRVRLHRGLQRLRERLVGWVGLLLAVLLGRPAAATSGPVRRAAGALLVVGSVALVVAAAAALRPESPPSPRPARAVAATTNAASGTADAPVDRRAPAAVGPSAVAAMLAVRVVDEQGRAVPAVGVTIAPAGGRDPVSYRRLAATGVDGTVRWPGLPPGRYRITADRGAATEVAFDGAAAACELTVARGVQVRGRVVDAAGAPVGGASIWLGSDTSGPWRGHDVTVADADGRFELAHVAVGSFVAARHPRCAGTDVHRLRAAGDGTAELELRLGATGGTVAVDVRGVDDAPIVDALVLVGESMDAAPLWLAQGAAAWRPPPFERRTDANGRARAGALPAGTVPVFVAAAGYRPEVLHVAVSAGATETRTVRLRPGASLRGHVVDADGRPVTGAAVALRADDPAHDVDLEVDGAGGFAFDGLPDGAVELLARADGHVPVALPLDLVAGAVVEHTVALPPARALRGVLERADGGALRGAELRARWPASALLPGEEVVAVDAAGTFAFAAAVDALPSLAVRLPGEPLWRDADAHTRWAGDAAAVSLPPTFAADAWLAGRLRRADGAPVARARLFVCRDGEAWAEIGHSDAAGRFRLGPLPPAHYELFAETTSSASPSALVGAFDLGAGAQRELDWTAPATGRIDVTFARADGAAMGDLAVTLVGTPRQRRVAYGAGERLQQVLLPGDYELWVMGGHVRWLEAVPLRVRAGATTTRRIELLPADRCALVLRGLPRRAGAPREFTLRERWRGEWTTHYTLLADAPLRLGAVLAAGDYELEHVDADGVVWRGTFAAPGPDPLHPIVVQMAPR